MEAIQLLINLPSIVEPREVTAVRVLRERLAQLAVFDYIAREIRLDLEARLRAAEAIAGVQGDENASDPEGSFDPAASAGA